jgi:type II secretory pathway pseudopilin PulG
MRLTVPSASDERGYTLVELMVAALVLVIGVLGTFTLLDGANRTTVTNNARLGATNLAREVLEDARSLDYDLLTPAQLVPALQAKPGMSGTGSPWKVKRRGIEYTVEASVCTFDDPKDGVAATPPANVCTPQPPVQAAAGTLTENQPDDFRRVTVKLTWTTAGNTARSITQTSLINNPSGGLGPRITKFEAPPDNVNQFTAASTSAVFPTTTTTAASLRWNSDGIPNGSGDSTGGPTTWTTSWSIGPAATPQAPIAGVVPTQYDGTQTVLDGTYSVAAQAYDDRGIAGDSKVAILPLNRSLPLTTTGFEAGRNTAFGGSGVVEFQWKPNPERDIIGYRVYNAGIDQGKGGGNDTLVCSTSSAAATSCTDMNPSALLASYYVVALDRTDITNATSTPRESPYASVVTVAAAAVPAPAAPSSLTVTSDARTGNPLLQWTHPDFTTVRFFRIYRDNCCNVADRYDSTPTNGSSWVDRNPGNNTSHKYWVTAVGPTFNESAPSPQGNWSP